MFDMIKGYSVEWKNGGYVYSVARDGKASFVSKKYPTHCMAEMAAIRYRKAH